MTTIEEVNNLLDEINNSELDVTETNYYGTIHNRCPLLRKALVCLNKISNIDNISKEEISKLCQTLDNIMKNKFKELNPDFTDEVLNNMVMVYKWGYIDCPLDIFVIDDVVFQKRAVLTEFGDVNDIDIFIPEGLEPYDNINSNFFNYNVKAFQFDDHLTREDNIYTSEIMSDNINKLYGSDITINKDYRVTYNSFRGYIYMNKKFYEISKLIKEKKECEIKICIQEKDSFTLYYINQTFVNDKPIWTLVKKEDNVWKLTDEIIKKKGFSK